MNIVQDVVIVGGGQAGLALGYYLKKSSRSFVILDANLKVGDSWRHRYDSLKLFTPRKFSGLPGLPFPGEPEGWPTKDEAAQYLHQYASQMDLPIELGVSVNRLIKEDMYAIHTNKGVIYSRNVVAATGPFQKSYIPQFSKNLDPGIIQMHSSEYRNSAQLGPGNVLVVGAGNSGAQIAVELANERTVYLSHGGRLNFKPLSIWNKSIFWYFDKLGLLGAEVDSRIGRWMKDQPEQIYGTELKQLFKQNQVVSMRRAAAAKDHTIQFEDQSLLQIDNVIWATGFQSDYSWIDVPGTLDKRGQPVHLKGVSPVPGLYFLGLPWQSARGSALMGWVAKDARFIASHLS